MLAPLTLFVVLSGCSRVQPALTVDDIAYDETELLGLTTERREALIALTALGVAASRSDLERLGEPLVEAGQRERLQRKLIAEVSLRSAGIDDEVLEARYLTDPDYELTVRHLIYLSDRSQPVEVRRIARAKAAAALARARGDEDLDALARELSEERGADRSGGLLPTAREGTWVQEFWDAALALGVGELSGVVESEFGFHVLRLEKRDVVPFAEARDGVVAEVHPLLANAAAWSDWQTEATAGIELHPPGLNAWLAGTAMDTTSMASWPGASMTVAEFDRVLAAQAGGTVRRLRTGSLDRLQTAVAGVARETMLVARAEDMDIRLSEVDEAEIRREWRDLVSSWTGTLGFREGLTGDEIKAIALDALGSTRQSVMIAREETLAHGPLFTAAYQTRISPVETASQPRT